MESDRIVELICKIIYIFMVKVFVPCFVCPRAMISFYLYFSTDLGCDAFDLPIPTWYVRNYMFEILNSILFYHLSIYHYSRCRFPFDWKNPVGYLVAIILQYQFVSYPCRYIGCFASLGFASFWFAVSAAKNIKSNLREINQSIKAKQHRSIIFQQFAEFIRSTIISQLSAEEEEKLITLNFVNSTISYEFGQISQRCQKNINFFSLPFRGIYEKFKIQIFRTHRHFLRFFCPIPRAKSVLLI